MPTVYVSTDPAKKSKVPRRVLQLVFPVRAKSSSSSSSPQWEWPELRVGVSDIVPSSPMFGLFPRSTEALNWEALERPVIMPYLGKETEVESASQARVLRTILCGNFDTLYRRELRTPPNHCWVQDGLYITCVTKKEARASENLKEVKEMDLELLQVCVHHDFNARGVSYMDEGDEQVCYLRRDEVERLLHLPPHIFELLASHEDDEHSDRNMATHLVQFQRRCVSPRAIRRARFSPRNSTRAILTPPHTRPSLAAPTSTCSCPRTRSSARRRT